MPVHPVYVGLSAGVKGYSYTSIMVGTEKLILFR